MAHGQNHPCRVLAPFFLWVLTHMISRADIQSNIPQNGVPGVFFFFGIIPLQHLEETKDIKDWSCSPAGVNLFVEHLTEAWGLLSVSKPTIIAVKNQKRWFCIKNPWVVTTEQFARVQKCPTVYCILPSLQRMGQGQGQNISDHQNQTSNEIFEHTRRHQGDQIRMCQIV